MFKWNDTYRRLFNTIGLADDETIEENVEIFEFTIDGKLYFVTNEINGDILEYIDENNQGEELGELIDGKPQWL